MLKESEDAYGRQIYEHHHGRRAFEIVERDDGYFDTSSGPMPYFDAFENWPPHQRQAMEYATGRVLDIGCGAGRHSLYLQEKGLEVVGIDNSPLAVETCKLRGLKNAIVVPIAKINSKLGKFDTILMLGNNFGLFGSFDRARRLLKRFHGITNAGARIIAESNDPYQTTEPFHLAYHELNRTRGRMSGQLRIRVRFKSYATPSFDYLLVSKDEMQQILAETGWTIGRFLDSGGSGYIAIINRE